MGQHHENDKAKLFKTQLGQQVAVERTTENSELGAKMNAALNEIGEKMNPLPKNLEYLGSAAVHVYYNETLKQAFFVTQRVTLRKVTSLLAQAAMKDLIGAVMEFYGTKRPKLRSGF